MTSTFRNVADGGDYAVGLWKSKVDGIRCVSIDTTFEPKEQDFRVYLHDALLWDTVDGHVIALVNHDNYTLSDPAGKVLATVNAQNLNDLKTMRRRLTR